MIGETLKPTESHGDSLQTNKTGKSYKAQTCAMILVLKRLTVVVLQMINIMQDSCMEMYGSRQAKYQRPGTQYYHHYSGCCDMICESNAV